MDVRTSSFFLPRRVEVVLVKGRVRCSGPTAGYSDPRISRAVDTNNAYETSSSSDDSDSFDSDLEFERELEQQQRYGYGQGYGLYGGNIPGNNRWMTDTAAARREWHAKKRGRRETREHKKQREKERRREKRYSLYLMCI